MEQQRITNTAEYTIKNVIPESDEKKIEVDLDIFGQIAYLGVYIDSNGNLRTVLGTGTNTYTVQGNNGLPVDFPAHFGISDIQKAYGGEASDYEIEIYTKRNGKTVIGRERLSAALPHEHDFSEDWKNNETGHWHVCKKCSSTSETEPHNLENGVCSECGYVKPEHVHVFTCTGVSEVHWDACKCGFTTNVDEHTKNGDICEKCGYKGSAYVGLNGDMNGDGEITLDDAIAVLKKAMKVTS